MKTINKNTKLGRHFWFRYNHPCGSSVQTIYKKPSDAKLRADINCMILCDKEGGYGYKIISAGIQFFSAAWLLMDGSLRVETYGNSYIVK